MSISDTNPTIEDVGDLRAVRTWHENGTLIREWMYKRNHAGTFLLHGESRQWRSSGELIGSFVMEDGSGIIREWYENGTLASELTMHKGKPTGLLQVWDESGYLLGDRFFYEGKTVPKKRYREIQQTNPEIPQYPQEAFANVASKRKAAQRQVTSCTQDVLAELKRTL